MPLIRIRKAGQVTLPLAICRALDLKEYDYLDATVTEGTIILKPVAVFAPSGMAGQFEERRATAQQGREKTKVVFCFERRGHLSPGSVHHARAHRF